MSTAHELFQVHKLQKYEPLLRMVNGSYLFEIEGVGHWFISVSHVAIRIEEARHDADCTIACNEHDFMEIVEGRQNLITAAMQGRVKIRGDMTLAQKFHGLVGAMVESEKQEKA